MYRIDRTTLPSNANVRHCAGTVSPVPCPKNPDFELTRRRRPLLRERSGIFAAADIGHDSDNKKNLFG
jgi:hypothetical protein